MVSLVPVARAPLCLCPLCRSFFILQIARTLQEIIKLCRGLNPKSFIQEGRDFHRPAAYYSLAGGALWDATPRGLWKRLDWTAIDLDETDRSFTMHVKRRMLAFALDFNGDGDIDRRKVSRLSWRGVDGGAIGGSEMSDILPPGRY